MKLSARVRGRAIRKVSISHIFSRKKDLRYVLLNLVSRASYLLQKKVFIMAREHVIIECTEARAESKPVSRYMTTRDKKQQPDRVEKKKYNKFLRRHTLHREIKS